MATHNTAASAKAVAEGGGGLTRAADGTGGAATGLTTGLAVRQGLSGWSSSSEEMLNVAGWWEPLAGAPPTPVPPRRGGGPWSVDISGGGAFRGGGAGVPTT